MKLYLSITFVFCLTIAYCQSFDQVKHPRFRRQVQNDVPMPDTASTVLSILPLDRIGALTGQMMATGLKEMFDPNVGKKLVKVLEVQAPLLLTSLFTNLYSTLRVPPRTTSLSSSSSLTNTRNFTAIQLTNSSTLTNFGRKK